MIKLRSLIREDGYGKPERRPIGTTNGENMDLDTISTLGSSENETSKGDVDLYTPEVDMTNLWNQLKQRYPQHNLSQQDLEDKLKNHAENTATRSGSNQLAYKEYMNKAKQSQGLKKMLYAQLGQFIKPVGQHLNDFDQIRNLNVAEHGQDETSGMENLQRFIKRAKTNNVRGIHVGDDVARDEAYGQIQGVKDMLGKD